VARFPGGTAPGCIRHTVKGKYAKHRIDMMIFASTVQVAKKELALATALAGARFPEGTAAGDRRHAAEAEYAVATAKVGIALNDAAIMAMAAEAFMNLSPWDYYEVSHLSGTGSLVEAVTAIPVELFVKLLMALY